VIKGYEPCCCKRTGSLVQELLELLRGKVVTPSAVAMTTTNCNFFCDVVDNTDNDTDEECVFEAKVPERAE
jgi:hypothetical protein